MQLRVSIACEFPIQTNSNLSQNIEFFKGINQATRISILQHSDKVFYLSRKVIFYEKSSHLTHHRSALKLHQLTLNLLPTWITYQQLCNSKEVTCIFLIQEVCQVLQRLLNQKLGQLKHLILICHLQQTRQMV